MLVTSTPRIIIGRALGLRSSSSSYGRQQHHRTDRSSGWRNKSSAKRFRKSDFMCDIGEEDVALVHGEILYGFHPVSMALSAGRRDFHAIYYNAEGKDKVLRLAEEAKAKGMPKFVKRPFVRLSHAIFPCNTLRNPRSRHRHPQPGGPLSEERPGPRRPPGRVRGRREALPLREGGAPRHGGRSGSSSISPLPAAAVRRQGPHEPRCRPQVSLLPGRRSCDHHSRVPFSFSYARYSQFGQFHIIPSFAPCCRKETI